MQKKRILVLGAGISGLSAAWYLSRTKHPSEITILEKGSRAGGWMHTDHTKGFLFEKGPRTFHVDKSPHTMQLISELAMAPELIWSESRQHHRYMWFEGELHRFPTNPFSAVLSPVAKGFIRALLTEWKQPLKAGDETVWEFIVRRFNYDVARLIFDPMVVGIFGGDIRKISVRACFPKLKAWEEKYGSVTKGFFAQRKERRHLSKFSSDIPELPLSAVFSFRSGMEQLPQTIVNQIPAAVHYHQEVRDVSFEGGQVVVRTESGQFEADDLFCALPVNETSELFKKFVPEAAKEFSRIPSEGLSVINLGYDVNVLPVQGFGYLAPTYANEDILGVVFDSSVFPEHNRRNQETRLTIMMRENGREDDVYIQAALRGIRRQLGVSRLPTEVSLKRAVGAIPQYGVGHLERMNELKQLLRAKLPQCYFLGNYLNGVSVDLCIARSKESVAEWMLYNAKPVSNAAE